MADQTGWQPIETLEHNLVDDSPLSLGGRPVPALYQSDEVLLSDGRTVWLGRSMVMGGARVRWTRDDLPTHWMRPPAPPEAAHGE